jgi:hypothetical protein
MINESDKKELYGVEAVEFAHQHLKKIKSSPDTWETEYICEKTGERWVLDYPHSECQGGGPPRLRKV